MVIFNIFLIAVCCVIVIDVLQFPESIQPLLSTLFGFKVKIGKPFSCSTCMTWWVGLAYMLIAGGLSLSNIALLLLISASTPQIENLYWNLQGVVGTIINLIKF